MNSPRVPGLGLEGPLAILADGLDRHRAEAFAGKVEVRLGVVDEDDARQEGVSRVPAKFLGDDIGTDIKSEIGGNWVVRIGLGCRCDAGQQADTDLAESGGIPERPPRDLGRAGSSGGRSRDCPNRGRRRR